MDEGCGNPYQLPYPRYAPKISTTDRTHARTGPETQRAAINGNPFARFRAGQNPCGSRSRYRSVGRLGACLQDGYYLRAPLCWRAYTIMSG